MNRKRQSAENAYADRSRAIEAKIAELQKMLKAHKAEAATQPKNWGFVGDLAEIDSRLAETIEFLTDYE